MQNVLERIHPLQFKSLRGQLSSHVIVVLDVRRDEHGDWSSSHEHLDVVALCGKVKKSERFQSVSYTGEEISLDLAVHFYSLVQKKIKPERKSC